MDVNGVKNCKAAYNYGGGAHLVATSSNWFMALVITPPQIKTNHHHLVSIFLRGMKCIYNPTQSKL